MRTRWRFYLALVGSLLLHGSLLMLSSPSQQRAAGGQREITITLSHGASKPVPATSIPIIRSPRKTVVSAPVVAPAVEMPSQLSPVADVHETVVKETLTSLLPVLNTETDATWYTAAEVEVRATAHDWIEPTQTAARLGTFRYGRVVLEVYINELGDTDHVIVLEADPPGRFDEVASESFQHVHWTPAVKEGRFVKSRKQIEVCFAECTEADAIYKAKIRLNLRDR